MSNESRGSPVEHPWALVLTGNREAAVRLEHDLRLRWREQLERLAEVEDGDPQVPLDRLVGSPEEQ